MIIYLLDEKRFEYPDDNNPIEGYSNWFEVSDSQHQKMLDKQAEGYQCFVNSKNEFVYSKPKLYATFNADTKEWVRTTDDEARLNNDAELERSRIRLEASKLSSEVMGARLLSDVSFNEYVHSKKLNLLKEKIFLSDEELLDV